MTQRWQWGIIILRLRGPGRGSLRARSQKMSSKSRKGFEKSPRTHFPVIFDLSAANGGLRDGGLRKSEDIWGKRPFSSVFWIFQVLFRHPEKVEKGRKRAKTADFGRFPGRAARHPLNPHLLHPHLRQPNFWLFGPFSRLFSDLWDSGAGSPWQPFFEIFFFRERKNT